MAPPIAITVIELIAVRRFIFLLPFCMSEFDCDCLHFGVLLQPILAKFPSNSGLLESAEWSPGVEDIVTVHPSCAGPHIIYNRVSERERQVPRLGKQVSVLSQDRTTLWSEEK